MNEKHPAILWTISTDIIKELILQDIMIDWVVYIYRYTVYTYQLFCLRIDKSMHYSSIPETTECVSELQKTENNSFWKKL